MMAIHFFLSIIEDDGTTQQSIQHRTDRQYTFEFGVIAVIRIGTEMRAQLLGLGHLLEQSG